METLFYGEMLQEMLAVDKLTGVVLEGKGLCGVQLNIDNAWSSFQIDIDPAIKSKCATADMEFSRKAEVMELLCCQRSRLQQLQMISAAFGDFTNAHIYLSWGF